MKKYYHAIVAVHYRIEAENDAEALKIAEIIPEHQHIDREKVDTVVEDCREVSRELTYTK